MNQFEKLDIFVIEDRFNLSESELLMRANAIASDKSSQFGWSVSSVQKSNALPVKKGEALCHEFEIYGLVLERKESSASNNNEYAGSVTGIAAAEPSP